MSDEEYEDVDGQDVVEFIKSEFSIYEFAVIGGANSQQNEQDRCETYEIRIEKSWEVDITVHYKDRGGDEPFPDSPRWDCTSEDIWFDGDVDDFKKWLKKNWKEVYEGYDWG